MTPLQMVREYHETAGVTLDFEFPSVDYYNNNSIDQWAKENPKELKEFIDLAEFRHNLIEEEWEEAQEAEDPENFLKELADLVYVIYGTAASFGLDLDEAFKRVHENNMGRMYQDDGTIKRREDGKIIKNPSYPKVDLSDLI